MFFPRSSPSTNRTLLPSSIRASTFLRFRSQYYLAKPPFIAAIPATLAPSTTVAREGECYHVLFSSFVILHAFTAASPKSPVTAVVERLLENVAYPWRAPKYTSITYITFVLSLVSWKIQRSYLLHSMYLLRDCLSPHLRLHREEDKSTWGFEISGRNSTYITPSNACVGRSVSSLRNG